MADSIHVHGTNLDSYLEDIFVKDLKFSKSNLEVEVVQQLVHDMVNNIAKEAYPPDSGLTVREVIQVGSMAEGTRVRRPDEFDFMIVLDKYDADDITEINTDVEGTFLKLKTECRKEDCYFISKEPGIPFRELTTKTRECDCKFARPAKEMNEFTMLRNAFNKMARDGRSCSVEYFPGKLRISDNNGFCLQGPAITIILLWERCDVKEELKTMKIYVDLVLVIEIEINAFLLDQLDVFHQHFYNQLKAIKKIHILHLRHYKNGVFQVSFALSEVKLLRSESETHKKCYKLLKYIYRTNKSYVMPVCSSFALKNLVLQHAVSCEGVGLGWCLLKILGDLRDKFGDERSEMPFIPHIFCTKKNLIRSDTTNVHLDSYQEVWDNHRKDLSGFIENLEKFRDGSPIPSLFQFRIPNPI